ncbi:MAG TPA: ATP-binding protein [Acetobacteraceae bacterium]|nr:ATP-binding protein [Acetobacteraceae bacterium]
MPPIDLNLLAARESEQVEWKENVADIDDVVAALCAFANDLPNLGGGYVVCGAQEVRDEHGFPATVRTGLTAARLKEVEGRVLARCRERVAPPLTPLVDELPADTDDRRVLVFTQPATPSAHTFRRDNQGGRHYVRVGRSTIEARNSVLLNLLVRKGAVEPWDRRVCSTATERDLDLLALRDMLNQMRVTIPEGQLEQFLSDDVSLSPFIPTLCVRESLTNILRPRNFAILLFGRNVQRFIPGAFSLFSVYPGLDRSDRHAERHEIAGTVIEQARQLRQLLTAQVSTVFDKENLATPNAEKYPVQALLEAMGNALAHRDYELTDAVRITSFADRVEFISPGSLPLGVDAAALERGEATPKWRNQALAWFFNRLQFAQAEGQGIPTILRTMRDEGCPPPIFKATAHDVLCVLPAHPRHVLKIAIVQAEQAAQRGDMQRLGEWVELIIEKLDLSEGRIAVDPGLLLGMIRQITDRADLSAEIRPLCIRLIAIIGKIRLSEQELKWAEDLLFRLREVPGLVRLIDDQLTAIPRQEQVPRFLKSLGDVLARAAVQAANSGEYPNILSDGAHDATPPGFERAAEEATRLYLQAEQQSANDPELASTARRGLALIDHLRRQRALPHPDRNDDPAD